MEIFDTTQHALEIAMHGAALRHEAISRNIANVNTPGYRRRDVDFEDALGAAMRSGDGRAVSLVSPVERQDPSAPLRVDGNSVDIDVESANQARNGLTYEALVTVAKARMTTLQTAIGNR